MKDDGIEKGRWGEVEGRKMEVTEWRDRSRSPGRQVSNGAGKDRGR
jgi:hypothetical protein